MLRSVMHRLRICLVSSLAVLSFYSASAENTLWAKGAHHFLAGECPPGHFRCTLASVTSPDKKNLVTIRLSNERVVAVVRQGSRIFQLRGFSRNPGLPPVEMEIFWSPDSSAASIAWNENAITDYSAIYKLTPAGPRPVNLRKVMADFVHVYPACIGVNSDCYYARDGSDDNCLTVAWAAPHTVVLMAEAPESSEYGRNMAQVIGYEVDADSGAITRRMMPTEFKKRWQSQLGWDFRIPE